MVLANAGPPGKWPLKRRERERWSCLSFIQVQWRTQSIQMAAVEEMARETVVLESVSTGDLVMQSK